MACVKTVEISSLRQIVFRLTKDTNAIADGLNRDWLRTSRIKLRKKPSTNLMTIGALVGRDSQHYRSNNLETIVGLLDSLYQKRLTV